MASAKGLHSYEVALQYRLMRLADERLADLRAIPEGPDAIWLLLFSRDPDRDTAHAVWLNERRQNTARGWAARQRAEMRQVQACRARLGAAIVIPDY